MKVIKAILSIITAIFLIVGIPIIINECYKADCGYITVWDESMCLGIMVPFSAQLLRQQH